MRLENIISKPRQHITVEYKPETESIWIFLKPLGRYCINFELLSEAIEIQEEIKRYFLHHHMRPENNVKYIISASKSPGVYSYGGDLNLFSKLIEEKNIDHLTKYAEACIKLVYNNATNIQLPVTTVSLVQGTALGGGFEGALSGSILIAEEGSKMGFPEIRFNLFPGMGAYSFVARKAGVKIADEVICSGQIYKPEYLQEKGVVDLIAKTGKGIETTNKFIKKHSRSFNGRQAILDAKQRFQPICFNELMDITKIWVDAAMRLTPKDIKMMQKLVSMQNTKVIEPKYGKIPNQRQAISA